MDKVIAINPSPGKKISQLLDEMKNTGFQGRKLGECVDVFEKMIKDSNTTIILGYAASMSTTGQWKIINWLIENRFVDVIVATGANISEDIVEAMGFSYLKGTHIGNQDKKLLEKGINRYYDVYGKETDYVKMIELLEEFTLTLESNKPYATQEFLYKCGKFLLEKNINSIIATAAKNNVPVFCPAIADSPYGDAVIMALGSKKHNLVIDAMQELRDFMGIAKKVKDVGVIYIGGGVPKDFIQLLAVTSPLQFKNRHLPNRKSSGKREGINEGYYPHKYAIQITTDSPQWGSLSGCTFEEAVSWGKINEDDNNRVQCYCDATIALPIISHALSEKITEKRNGTDLSYIFNKSK